MTRSLVDRFEEKIDKTNYCWNWKANKNNMGYGMIRLGGLQPKKLAHRVSYEIKNGKIPDGVCVLHKCDNPACVNPEHLFLGNKKDNYYDMVKKGRRVLGRNPNNNPPISYGESHPRAKFSNKEANEIRILLSEGYTARGIARALKVDKGIILKIKHNKTYKIGVP